MSKSPTVGQIANATGFDGEPVGVGARLPHWNGTEIVYYTVTAHDLKKVARYTAREDKRRDHLLAKIAKWDREAEHAEQQQRAQAAAERLAKARTGIQLIAAAR